MKYQIFILTLQGWKTYLCRLKKRHRIKAVTPYQEQEATKKDQVRRMFDKIARHYDFLNHFLSLGIDRQWRRKAVAKLGKNSMERILDVATGTGDVALTLARKYPDTEIIGVDIAENMLGIAKKKLEKEDFADRVRFEPGDSENLRFPDNSFDAVTVAFGVRNYEHLQLGLQEMNRVTRPGGKVVILEFTKPVSFPFKQLFNGYFKYLLPMIGRLRSRDNRAYSYLYESVQAFPDYDRFTHELTEAGWSNAQYQSLTLGICAIYTAVK